MSAPSIFPNFPQRWAAIFLASLTANHFLITLIATCHLDPLLTYRAVTVALIAALCLMIAREGAADQNAATAGCIRPSAVGREVARRQPRRAWLHLHQCLEAWGPQYIPGQRRFGQLERLVVIWSQGSFPTTSYGYPQFIPTTWAATYIFTGSTEQYFAYYTYHHLHHSPHRPVRVDLGATELGPCGIPAFGVRMVRG